MSAGLRVAPSGDKGRGSCRVVGNTRSRVATNGNDTLAIHTGNDFRGFANIGISNMAITPRGCATGRNSAVVALTSDFLRGLNTNERAVAILFASNGYDASFRLLTSRRGRGKDNGQNKDGRGNNDRGGGGGGGGGSDGRGNGRGKDKGSGHNADNGDPDANDGFGTATFTVVLFLSYVATTTTVPTTGGHHGDWANGGSGTLFSGS